MRVAHAIQLTTFFIAITAIAHARPTDNEATSLDFSSRQSIMRNDDGFDTVPAYEHDATIHASYAIRTRPAIVYRPESPLDIEMARQRSMMLEESTPIEWRRIEVQGPDIEDRHTLQELARMSGNSYALPGQKNWYELDEAWNKVR
jgi:lipase ATG15